MQNSRQIETIFKIFHFLAQLFGTSFGSVSGIDAECRQRFLLEQVCLLQIPNHTGNLTIWKQNINQNGFIEPFKHLKPLYYM